MTALTQELNSNLKPARSSPCLRVNLSFRLGTRQTLPLQQYQRSSWLAAHGCSRGNSQEASVWLQTTLFTAPQCDSVNAQQFKAVVCVLSHHTAMYSLVQYPSIAYIVLPHQTANAKWHLGFPPIPTSHVWLTQLSLSFGPPASSTPDLILTKYWPRCIHGTSG